MKEFFLPFKGVFCRVQPIAFDGTLSFLELLNKLQHYVNKLNENINAVADDLEALTAFVNEQITDLYTYIDTGLAGKQDVLTWDELPTAESENPVYSKGIKTYVDTGLAGKQDTLTFDESPLPRSTNPVYSRGIYSALLGKQDTLTFDEIPTDGSSNPVYSKGIYSVLLGKQDTLTFDTTPTNGSTNPVESGGIYTALADKQKSIVYDDITYNNGLWVGTLMFADITAYISQGRQIILRSIDPVSRTQDTVTYFYLTEFNGLDTYKFSSEKGYFEKNILDGFNYGFTAR